MYAYNETGSVNVTVSDTGSLACLGTIEGELDAASTNYLYKKDKTWNLKGDVTIPQGFTLNIAEKETLIVPKTAILNSDGNITVSGLLLNQGGTVSGNVTVEGKGLLAHCTVTKDALAISEVKTAQDAAPQTYVLAAFNADTLVGCDVSTGVPTDKQLSVKTDAGNTYRLFLLNKSDFALTNNILIPLGAG